jgi:hypothetical protein
MLHRLEQFRSIAARYDKTALSVLGFLNLAAVELLPPAFVNGSGVPVGTDLVLIPK